MAPALTLRVQLLRPGAVAPFRATPESAGLDLVACEDVVVPARAKAVKVDLGIALAVPRGYYGRIAPRSGLSVRTGLAVLAGVVDSDYRGPVAVVFQNATDEPAEIRQGDRVAQLVCERIGLPAVAVVADLGPETARGAGGFGSTGSTALGGSLRSGGSAGPTRRPRARRPLGGARRPTPCPPRYNPPPSLARCGTSLSPPDSADC